MFISHKSNVIQSVHDVEWQCRRKVKGQTKAEYWTWLDSVTSGDPPVVDYSGETGYTIVECIDEDVPTRLTQLEAYQSRPERKTKIDYNIKYYASKRDAEEIKDVNGNSHDPKQYVQSHFVGQDDTRDTRLLAEEWTHIRAKRDEFLTNSDWTQGADTPLGGSKKTEWTTYRTKLRTLPVDQSSVTTYADITWPTEPE